MQVLQKRYKNAICVALLSAAILTMIIAVGYYFGGEVGFDGMINGDYMNIGNSYAAAAEGESVLLITPAGSLADNGNTVLDGAYSIAIFNAIVDNKEDMYAIVANRVTTVRDNGIQIINVTDPYYPKAAGRVNYDPFRLTFINLDHPNRVETFTFSDSVYAIVTNTGGDEGIQIINVTNPYSPVDVGTVSSIHGNDAHLNTPEGLDTFNIGDHWYAIVTSRNDGDDERPVTMINMTEYSEDSISTDFFDIKDKTDRTLKWAHDVDIFTVDGDDFTYAIVASLGENGIQIINVTTPYVPVFKGNLVDSDDNTLVLDKANSVDTFNVTDYTYAIVTSRGEDGIQIINVTDTDDPVATGSLTRANFDSALKDPYDVETFTLDGSAYAIVAGNGNDTNPGSIQIIDVTNPNTPGVKGSATYDDGSKYPTLDKVKGVATFNVAGDSNNIYAIVASSDDVNYDQFTERFPSKANGIQIVRITNTDMTPPSLVSSPILNLDSRILSFGFTETIDVSEINWAHITINNKDGEIVTSLAPFNLPSVDSPAFEIEITGLAYRSMFETIDNGKGPLQITILGSEIQDFNENYFEGLNNVELNVIDSRASDDLLIIPASSITKNATIALDNAYGIDIFTIDDNPYAVIASDRKKGGIQIINMTDPYYPKALANVTNTDEYPTALVNARGVATFNIGTERYAAVTSDGGGDSDNDLGGIQIIGVTAPNVPVVKGNLTNNSVSTELNDPYGVATFNVTDYTYAIVASRGNDANLGSIQIINMTDPLTPKLVGFLDNGASSYLIGANDVATFTIDDNPYAIVASSGSNGFQIINMTDPKKPLSAGRGKTSGGAIQYDYLNGASGVATFNVTDYTYAIIAAGLDDGFQIINMTDPYNPLRAGSGTDGDANGYDTLDGAYGVDTFEIGDAAYAIIASRDDDGLQIINVTDPSIPLAAGSLSDDHTLVLKNTHSVATFNAGCNTYAIATSRGEDGIQIMELIDDLTVPVITLKGDKQHYIVRTDDTDLYEDPGTMIDGDSSLSAVVDATKVVVSEIGSYFVYYDYTDSSCNAAAQVSRTVTVIDSSFAELQKITAPDGADGDQFGISVSVSGDTAIIGAYGDDDENNGSLSSGSAYIFEKNNGDEWIETQKLTVSDGEKSDWFGYSVSISGDTAIIGAYGDDDNNDDSGSAYIFEKNSGDEWMKTQKITAPDGGTGDYFGYSVSVSGDTAIIGAYGDDTNIGDDSGSAYIFEKNSGDEWMKTQKITASSVDEEDYFGYSVSVSGDTAIIGAYGDDDTNIGSDSGSAYIFERNTDDDGNWPATETQKLIAPDGERSDQFGISVSVSGDTAIIGANRDDTNIGSDSGSAYIFERNTDDNGNWLTIPLQKLTASDGAESDYFGYSVSISGDTAIIGAYGDDDNGAETGSAYIFKKNSDGTWSKTVKLVAGDDGAAEDRFGYSVAVSDENIVIGAYQDDDDNNGANSGSAYIRDNGSPVAHATVSHPTVVFPGNIVTLDGSGSTDNIDPYDDLEYKWTQTGGSPKVTLIRYDSSIDNITLTSEGLHNIVATGPGPDSSMATFIVPDVFSTQILTFSLVVTDTNGISSSNTAEVTVTISPSSGGDNNNNNGGSGGGGSSSGGSGGGGSSSSSSSSIQIDDIYIRSVSWDCNAGTIKIIAGPDSEYLSVAVRTTQLGVHQASMTADNQIPGYKTFVSSMAQTEDYIGIQAVAPHGRNVNVVNESINIDSCVGERTYQIPGDDDLSTATTTTKQQLAPSTVDPEPSTAAPAATTTTASSSSSAAVDPEPEPPVCGPGTEVADGFCRIIIPSEGEEPEENGGSSSSSTTSSGGGGCLIATAAYGTELAPQVQFLREVRENTVLQTQSGSAFMDSFNLFYYSFSPGIADLERQNPIFREAVKIAITPMISSLAILGYADIDSESEMLAYGIGIVALNIGLYVALPVSAMYCVAARFGGVMFAKSSRNTRSINQSWLNWGGSNVVVQGRTDASTL